MKHESSAEAAFAGFWATMCRTNQLESPIDPVTEYVFSPPRRWRFDFAWPAYRVAVEMEGGAWVSGRHVRPAGFQADMEKYNRAASLGWHVLRFTPQQLKADPQGAYETILDALNEGSKP